MEISFVRTEGRADRVYVRRSDGTETSWSFPTYGDWIPHDLVHLVVETAFGLWDGFWGRVDRGIEPGRINADANRIGGADKYAAFGADQVEFLIAEALAGTRWLDPSLTDAEIAGDLARRCPRLAPVAVERIASVRAAIERLNPYWKALRPRGTVKARFDPDDLEASFGELARAR